VLPLISVFVCALAVSVVVLGIFMRLPLARHFADLPDHRKVHQSAIPRIGGIGIAFAFLALLVGATMLGLWNPDRQLFGTLLFVGLFLLAAGTLDDVLSLGYKVKFLLQFLMAILVVSVFQTQFDHFSLLGYVLPLGEMGLVISVFWMVAIMNAVNIIDGIDGLAGGVALCGFLGIGALGYASGAMDIVAVCVALAGATLGFLRYNLDRRRKIFLGDTGSQFLGATLALLIMRIHALPSVGYSILIPVLLVAYPILDTSVAMARRFLRVRHRDLGHRVSRMFIADNEHLHHRLVYTGLSHTQATFLLMLLASGMAATAVVLPRVTWQVEAGIVVYLAGAMLFILNRLGFIQRSSGRRILRAWILGGVYPEGSRFARHQLRYYEIFALTDPEPGVTGQRPEWSGKAPVAGRETFSRPEVLAKEF
jgi:UDP-GlcNAc:undecaprenyl-phosphate GlcNAc-1-phosphate transferase